MSNAHFSGRNFLNSSRGFPDKEKYPCMVEIDVIINSLSLHSAEKLDGNE